MDLLKKCSTFYADVDFQEYEILNNFKSLNILFLKLLYFSFSLDLEICLLFVLSFHIFRNGTLSFFF